MNGRARPIGVTPTKQTEGCKKRKKREKPPTKSELLLKRPKRFVLTPQKVRVAHSYGTRQGSLQPPRRQLTTKRYTAGNQKKKLTNNVARTRTRESSPNASATPNPRSAEPSFQVPNLAGREERKKGRKEERKKERKKGKKEERKQRVFGSLISAFLH